MISRVRRCVLVTVALCASWGLGAGASLAVADDTTPQEAVAAATSAVDAANAPMITPQSEGAAAYLPETASDGVQVPSSSGGLGLGLPASGTGDAVGSASVFDGRGADNSIITEPVASGARVLVQLESALAPSTYRFPITGATRLEQNADGSITVYDATGDAAGIPAATIAPPWAKDANGQPVPTSYAIDGTTVIQRVQVDENTAFPVTADPTFQGSCGWFTCTIRLSRGATRNARDAAWIIGAAGGACGVVTAGAAAIVCGAAIAPGAVVLAVAAGRFYEEGDCLAINFTHPPLPSIAWPSRVEKRRYNCR